MTKLESCARAMNATYQSYGQWGDLKTAPLSDDCAEAMVRAVIACLMDVSPGTIQLRALADENFALAAGVCINPGQHGLVGDEHGNSICTAHEAYLKTDQELSEVLAERNAAEARAIAAEEALAYTVSCLCSVRKNYEDDYPLWTDVRNAISQGNAVLAQKEVMDET